MGLRPEEFVIRSRQRAPVPIERLRGGADVHGLHGQADLQVARTRQHRDVAPCDLVGLSPSVLGQCRGVEVPRCHTLPVLLQTLGESTSRLAHIRRGATSAWHPVDHLRLVQIENAVLSPRQELADRLMGLEAHAYLERG